MKTRFIIASLFLFASFGAHAQSSSQSTDSWGEPIKTAAAPPDSAASQMAVSGAEQPASDTTSSLRAMYASSPAPAAPTPVATMPKLNPNSATSPYNAKAVKKSRELAVKKIEKQQRRTFKARDIRERSQDKAVREMRRGRGKI